MFLKYITKKLILFIQTFKALLIACLTLPLIISVFLWKRSEERKVLVSKERVVLVRNNNPLSSMVDSTSLKYESKYSPHFSVSYNDNGIMDSSVLINKIITTEKWNFFGTKRVSERFYKCGDVIRPRKRITDYYTFSGLLKSSVKEKFDNNAKSYSRSGGETYLYKQGKLISSSSTMTSKYFTSPSKDTTIEYRKTQYFYNNAGLLDSCLIFETPVKYLKQQVDWRHTGTQYFHYNDTLLQKYVYRYGSSGEILQVSFVYDQYARVIEKTKQYCNSEGAPLYTSSDEKTTYLYEEDGLLVFQTFYYWKGGSRTWGEQANGFWKEQETIKKRYKRMRVKGSRSQMTSMFEDNDPFSYLGYGGFGRQEY